MSERTTYLMKQWRERALAAETKVEQLEGDVIEEENRANENATLAHGAREAAARLVEGLRVHVDDDPYSTCPDGCGWFNYAAKMIREQLTEVAQ